MCQSTCSKLKKTRTLPGTLAHKSPYTKIRITNEVPDFWPKLSCEREIERDKAGEEIFCNETSSILIKWPAGIDYITPAISTCNLTC